MNSILTTDIFLLVTLKLSEKILKIPYSVQLDGLNSVILQFTVDKSYKCSYN